MCCDKAYYYSTVQSMCCGKSFLSLCALGCKSRSPLVYGQLFGDVFRLAVAPLVLNLLVRHLAGLNLN